MRMAICQLKECSIAYGEFSRTLGRGAQVDLDQVVGQHPIEKFHQKFNADGDEIPGHFDVEVVGHEPVTIEKLLGDRISNFELVNEAKKKGAAAAAAEGKKVADNLSAM